MSYPFLYALKSVHEGDDWDAMVTLTPHCVEALSLIPAWWSWAKGKPFIIPSPSHLIITDSCSVSCAGLVALPQQLSDFLSLSKFDISADSTVYHMWRNPDQFHINWKELKAFLLTITKKAQQLRGLHVGAVIDNTVAASYVRKGGGAVSQLAQLAWNMSRILISERILLVETRVVKSEENPADEPSRLNESTHMWSLSRSTFSFFLSRAKSACLPMPNLDAFADAHNNLLPLFISRFFEPTSVGTDFFTSDAVAGKVLWCNPPWYLMSRVLGSFSVRKLRGYILAPVWLHAQWYPVFLREARWKYYYVPKADTFVHPLQRPPRANPLKYRIVVGYFDFSSLLSLAH